MAEAFSVYVHCCDEGGLQLTGRMSRRFVFGSAKLARTKRLR